MGPGPQIDHRRAADALIDWWSLAGVDWFVAEPAPGGSCRDEADAGLVATAKPKVAEPQRPARPADQPAPPASVFPLPGDLAEVARLLSMREWFRTPEGVAPVLPRGPAGARLMVLTDLPEDGDAATGRLLDGPHGRLVDAMLAAAGIDPSAVYVASMVPFAEPASVLDRGLALRLADFARRHVALAEPEALLCLGLTVSDALFGAQSGSMLCALPKINQQGAIPAVGIKHPRTYGQHWQGKRDAWHCLLKLVKE